MEAVLRQQIEKIVPLTDAEFRLVLFHFLVSNYIRTNTLFSREILFCNYHKFFLKLELTNKGFKICS